jgi:hypothetical protein
MNRKEKKQIRLQIIQLLDTHCAVCSERTESKSSLCLTSCSVGQQMQRLSSMLEGKFNSQPSHEDVQKRGKWSAEEEFYLWHHRHVLTIWELSEKLNRDPELVLARLQQLIRKGGISHIG